MKCAPLFPLLLLTMPSLAAMESKVRPVFDNFTDQRGTANNTYVHGAIQGLPDATKAAGGVKGKYHDGAVTLEESSLGQPFAPFDPAGTYVAGIVASVRSKLYPTPTATRSEVNKSIAEGGTAFRYLSLLYSQDIGSTDVTNHFQEMGQWYGTPERNLIAQQITILEEALANAPLDTRLRGLLLDAYTDRAVAEMQFVKQDLEALGTVRLGLVLTSAFIIDEEITLLKNIADKYQAVITQFAGLFSNAVDGVEPADFDPSVARGIPFGYYIFQKEQPNRNQVRSRYFATTDDNAVPVDLPVFNEATLTKGQGNAPGSLAVSARTATSVTLSWSDNSNNETGFLVEFRPLSGAAWPTGPGVSTAAGVASVNLTGLTTGQAYMFRVSAKLGTNVNSAPSNIVTETPSPASVVPRPVNEILSSGYRDYVTLLTVMGEFVNRSAELNRLRGLRQLARNGNVPSDLETARTQISSHLSTVPTNLAFLRAMFSEDRAAFQPGDTSGIFAARTGVENALASLTNTRSFLNGTANLLGLDPNFLILLQTDSEASYTNEANQIVRGFDSFAQIVSRLRGASRPLTVALAKQTDARNKFNTFRESVDQVVAELYNESLTYADRFREITGFEVEILDPPVRILPELGAGGAVLAQWDEVNFNPYKASELKQVATERALLNNTLNQIKAQLTIFEASEARANTSLSLAKGLDQARTTAETNFLSQTNSLFDGLAISNGLAAAGQATAEGAYAATSATIPILAAAAAAAGVTNAALQGLNAGASVTIQQQIDAAGRKYETTLSQADNALAVSQAEETIQGLQRDKTATTIQQQEVLSAIAQLAGRESSLRAEIIRIKRIFDASNEYIRGTLHANPIHYVRSQSAIIEADAAFAEAQRWMFYAQRALEHKWTQRFAVTSGGKNYDSGSLFKMRNAEELDDLLTAYFNFDANRELGQTPKLTTSVISFKNHLLTPKPNLFNISNPPENYLRADADGKAVPQDRLFRQKLASYRDSAGNIIIPFNTAQLQDIEGLFTGPQYGPSGSIIGTGQWRDKIAYVKVNIVAIDGPVPGPGGLQPRIVNGSISYGGLNYFRTRVVPGGTPALYGTQPNNAISVVQDNKSVLVDRLGEFSINTFRNYTSPNLDNIFVTQDRLLGSGSLAYTALTAKASSADLTQEDILGETFKFNDFRELSVAADGWTLTIFGTQPNQAINLDRILDIEFIIRHRSFSRVVPSF